MRQGQQDKDQGPAQGASCGQALSGARLGTPPGWPRALWPCSPLPGLEPAGQPGESAHCSVPWFLRLKREDNHTGVSLGCE